MQRILLLIAIGETIICYALPVLVHYQPLYITNLCTLPTSVHYQPLYITNLCTLPTSVHYQPLFRQASTSHLPYSLCFKKTCKTSQFQRTTDKATHICKSSLIVKYKLEYKSNNITTGKMYKFILITLILVYKHSEGQYRVDC